ncbi:19380_t:CDS:10 [Funneliformis geosporum]|uniref:19380_t:CDS:1 n=1 Tax=Funneliformis geosporum TaxID=1117311 RepID=A0A9W4SFE8_9GLOM|nr:19380_t:CDS:10 [Funneliformis geosporum]
MNIVNFVGDKPLREDPFSSDFFKDFQASTLPSHGQIKRVHYNKQDAPENLPDEFSLFVKPTEKVDYQVSNCTGRKRAVLIGINYVNTRYQLGGCFNDVKNIKEFITKSYGYDESNMKVLTDSPNRRLDPTLIPTRENIINAIKWLVHDPKANDSGHGGQLVDESGEEEDGFDETIMPLDFEINGQIIDDELHNLMVAPLPAGVRLTVIFDCCHSGTVLDLPYIYSTRGVIKETNILSLGGRDLLNAGFNYFKSGKGVLDTIKGLKDTAAKHQKLRFKNIETKSSPADIIMFSGCKDTQTSADAQEAGEATGAMSHALVKSLRLNPNPTYQELLNSIRDVLKAKYAQKPQLSTSGTTVVLGTFGCGKTRLCFEALYQNYGLYLVAYTYNIGSNELELAARWTKDNIENKQPKEAENLEEWAIMPALDCIAIPWSTLKTNLLVRSLSSLCYSFTGAIVCITGSGLSLLRARDDSSRGKEELHVPTFNQFGRIETSNELFELAKSIFPREEELRLNEQLKNLINNLTTSADSLPNKEYRIYTGFADLEKYPSERPAYINSVATLELAKRDGHYYEIEHISIRKEGSAEDFGNLLESSICIIDVDVEDDGDTNDLPNEQPVHKFSLRNSPFSSASRKIFGSACKIDGRSSKFDATKSQVVDFSTRNIFLF